MSVTRPGRTRAAVGALIVGTLIVEGLIVAACYHFGAQQYLAALFAWVNGFGIWAPFLYLLLHAAAIVLLLPGVFFAVGAGFFFGLAKGSIIVVTATTLGAGSAFMLARSLLGERAKRYLLAHGRVQYVTAAITTGGWRVILLTRLIPFFPFKLSNYVFGLMDFRLRDFLIGTAVGVIPLNVINVYVGSLAGDFATATAFEHAPNPLEWSLYGSGLLIAAGALLHIGGKAKRALREYDRAHRA